MIRFTNADYKNFHVNMVEDQIVIVVSLNVTPDMKEFLSVNNVYKANKHLTYVLKTSAPIAQMNESRILSMANVLINRAMIHCREAKQKVILKQIERIKLQSPRIKETNLVF